MKTLLTLIACAFVALSATAYEIIRGTTLTDGQQLYASDLHGLIDNSTISVQFYNDQQTTPSLNSGYYFLVLDPANQVFRRITAQTVLYGNTNIFINVPVKPVPAYGSILFYDPTNGWIGSTTLSNLFGGLSGNINVAGLKFATTNNAGATNQYVLPYWPYEWSGFQTNQQPMILTWDTNGIPYQQSLSNFENGVAADMGTNLSLPFTYNQLFQPWMVYGTNTYGFTNAWGFQTNFPITSLYLTNSYPASTNTPELVDADTVPVNSTQQQTNTTATLGGIYQYLAAKNTLPPYTTARIQFSGYPATITISNDANTASGLLHVATNSFPTSIAPPYAVAVITNASQIQVSAFTTNTLFYVVPQATNNGWVHVYTNYLTAVAGTAWLPVANSGSGTKNQFLYLTNYTSFNADVMQVITPPTTIRTGVYDFYFRTNSSTTPYYYVTSNAMEGGTANNATIVNFSGDNIITTNNFRIATMRDDGTMINAPLIQVLVNPQ